MACWLKLKDFDALMDTMILFLEGKVKNTPWHVSNVDPETIPLLPDLILINKKGILTICGQPGTILRNKIKYVGETKIGELGEDYLEVQRGYLQCFVLNSQRDIASKLLETGKVSIVVEQEDSCTSHGVLPEMLIPTKNRISLTEEIGSLKTEYYTTCGFTRSTFLDEISFLKNKDLYAFMRKNTSLLTIIMKKQGDTQLQKLILSVVK